MKVLITGSSGMLAKAVINELKGNDIICTDKNSLDITEKSKVIDFISKNKPEHIINCAAYTDVDRAEIEKELARKINSIGVENLAEAAKSIDATLIHISTDYVFDGELDLDKEYTETDLANPKTIYGLTKLEGEKSVKEKLTKFYIFRTAWLYGDGKNFVRTMLKLGKEKSSLNVVDDQYGTPTYTKDLAKIIKQSIIKKIPYGVYHATNEDYTNWYEFARSIFKICNINCIINPVKSEEYVRPAKRPKNSKMSKNKLKQYGICPRNYKEALEEYLKEEMK